MQLFARTLYERHPYRLDTLGTLDSVSRIERQALIRYYRQNFAADKMVLAVVGDVDPGQVKDKFSQLFASPVRSPSAHPQVPLEPRRTAAAEAHEKLNKQQAHLVIDLPFMSYQVSPSQALESAGRLVKEGAAHAVKLEGGAQMADTVRAMARAGIPVCGHLGLTPQTANMLGGYRVQGRTAAQARSIRDDALLLEKAGAFMLVLECVPDRVAALISQNLTIPVIGIGAGSGCDGQVLVLHDMLGIGSGFKPKFVKKYAELEEIIFGAAKRYGEEVKAASFPGPEQGFAIPDEEFEQISESLGK